MKLIKVCLLFLSLAGCEALFGIEVTPNIPEAATITNACLKLVSVSQQIRQSVNNVGELSFTTFLLQTGATSFVSSVSQTYTTLASIAQELNTVTNANTGNLNTIFSAAITSMKAFTSITIDERFAKWLILQNSGTSPDFSTIILTLNEVIDFFENTLQPGMKTFASNRILQATFYSVIPKQKVSTVAQKLTEMADYHETVVLPFVNRLGSTFRMTSDKLTMFLTSTDQAFQHMDGTLTSTYARFIELTKTARLAANEMQPTIRSSVQQFTKQIQEFTDLYVGGSASEYAKSATDMYSSWLNTLTEQMKVIDSHLERTRNAYSDSVLVSFGQALALGFRIVTQSLLFTIQNATNRTNVSCSEQAFNKFINDFGTFLRNSMCECFSGSDYDISTPINAQMTTVRDIQKDIAQYFNQLTNAVGGLSNSSPLSARMQLDMFLTAFFSQSNNITPTLLQQLVNMATELGVDYDLLIGRTRYCLAMSLAVADRMTIIFSNAIAACLS
uniref:Protein TsetseEP domain-containing protein n=1 Tax=Anopheles minimus TaxID=112268 RepID=A0A182W8M8_9DIPT